MTVHNLYTGQVMGFFILRQRLPTLKTGAVNLRKRWRVECKCGTKLTVPEYYLTRKQPAPKQHCGCMRKTDKTIHVNVYRIWVMMRRRCNDPSHVSYRHYGGRGIKVCPEWDNDENGFENFLAFIGPRPSMKHTIDRVDNDEGYRPTHPVTGAPQVRWATADVQRANQRPRK